MLKSRWIKTYIVFLPLVVFLFVMAIFFSRISKDSREIPSAFIGKLLPNFTADALSSYPKLTRADIGGGAVVALNIFSSWCATCIVEYPALRKLKDSVPLYGLAWKDKPYDTIAWLEKMGNIYAKIGSDPSGRIGINLGVYGVPETYIIDKKGIVRYRHVGVITDTLLQQKLLPLIDTLQKK